MGNHRAVFGVLLFLLVTFGSVAPASAFCTGDPGWQSYNTTLQQLGPTVTITVHTRVDHLFNHPSCNGVVAAKAMLLGVGPNCSDAQGVLHTDASNREVRFSVWCNNLLCGQTYLAGGEHWWGIEHPGEHSEFTQAVTGAYYSCPTPQEECEESGGTWACDAFCDCDYVNCPLMVDLKNNGLPLTNGPGGVDFDLRPDGVLERLAWTRSGMTDDVIFVLDRNGNGTIDDGRELFSNYAPRARGLPPNGFSVLATFDHQDYGGNADGVISDLDAVYRWLQLWADVNHDGISQPSELRPLGASLSKIDLTYRESRRTDEFGNLFKYLSNAILKPRGPTTVYDVFLVN